MRIRPLNGKVLVTEIEKGMRFINGFWIPNDDGKSEGIRPHWAKVYAVGPDVTEIKAGQWILIEHARWTRMMQIEDDDGKKIQLWGVDYPDGAMMVSDVSPDTTIFSKFVTTHAF